MPRARTTRWSTGRGDCGRAACLGRRLFRIPHGGTHRRAYRISHGATNLAGYLHAGVMVNIYPVKSLLRPAHWLFLAARGREHKQINERYRLRPFIYPVLHVRRTSQRRLRSPVASPDHRRAAHSRCRRTARHAAAVVTGIEGVNRDSSRVACSRPGM